MSIETLEEKRKIVEQFKAGDSTFLVAERIKAGRYRSSTPPAEDYDLHMDVQNVLRDFLNGKFELEDLSRPARTKKVRPKAKGKTIPKPRRR